MAENTNPFRGDNAAYRTSSLFLDRWKLMAPERQALNRPTFTLHQEIEGYTCARTSFLQEADPTGYRWAVKYLDGWQHWLRLMDVSWFKEAVSLWLSELEAKVSQESLLKIKEIAKGSSPAAFQAAKYLATQEYKKTSSRRGRPSKTEIETRLREATQTSSEDEADFQRMKPQLVVNN